jgi:hypothetical protein
MRMRFPVLCAAIALVAHAQTFRVSGIVVDSETGRPLDRTRVVLSGKAAAEFKAVTTADGKFVFEAPEGRYTLSATHRDWGDVYGEPMPGSDSGAAVIAGPDRNTTQLLFRFRAQVAIYGKVIDEDGEPVFDAGIELFQQTVTGGKKRLHSIGIARSNDFGEYSYSWLPAGVYYIAATGEPWYSNELSSAGEGIDKAGLLFGSRGPVYYPNTTDVRKASPLMIRSGMEFRADFVLRPSIGARLLPVCPGGNPCPGGFSLYAHGPERTEASVLTCAGGGCPQEMLVVPPGNYILRYKGPEGVARTEIDVHGGDNRMTIGPKPAPTLTGKITFDNPTHGPQHMLYVNFVDDDSSEVVTVAVGRDGNFSWPKPTAAHLRLYLSGSDGFFVDRMSVEGAIVNEDLIHVEEGANVRITLIASGETGTINGFVKDGEKPIPEALVILLPVANRNDPYRYLTVQSGTDGSYELTQAPVGEYLLFAVKDPELPYAEPHAVAPYLERGKRIRIDAHRTSSEVIGLASSARN